ncbi:MAG: acyl-CoA dehydrogenase family protein [Chloroflexi bacterium]|nr:acyl-CoA dehydrogenase family protein [Chloroflexota bacterium]
MDFTWSPQEQQFREEIRKFLRENLPDNWKDTAGDSEGEEREEFERAFAKKIGERGYLAIGLPKEYGGLGWTPLQQLIFNEEWAITKAPRSFMGPGVYQVAASLIIHGTEEQKRQFLPPIARGEVRWSTLFSEPNAGSDLASLQTSAMEDGDEFIVNGQKIWNSNAHKAEHGILLARTDPKAPKHKGISYFLVDMNWPGVKVVPIINMVGLHHFNTVFFDNVRIPRSRMLGEKNRGWYTATTSLNVERSGIRFHTPVEALYYELVDFVKESKRSAFDPLKANPYLTPKFAEMGCRVRVSKLLSYRVAWQQSHGAPPSYESSLSKVVATELAQQMAAFAMEVLGPYSQVSPGKWAKLHGKIERLYRAQRAATLGAGTSEVQRTIIARRGLGMGQGA